MGKNYSARGEKHGRLIRAVAIFFLLHAGADIALPQYFCPEDFGGHIAPASTASTDAARHGQRASAFDKSGGKPSETPSEQLPHVEDCFCCCAHVLLGADLSRVETYELNATQPDIKTDSLPSPPVRQMYRPPRLA